MATESESKLEKKHARGTNNVRWNVQHVITSNGRILYLQPSCVGDDVAMLVMYLGGNDFIPAITHDKAMEMSALYVPEHILPTGCTRVIVEFTVGDDPEIAAAGNDDDSLHPIFVRHNYAFAVSIYLLRLL